jgi:hypothetical protein
MFKEVNLQMDVRKGASSPVAFWYRTNDKRDSTDLPVWLS